MALRVLLADESTTIKKVMQLALQDFAVEVKSVHSGIDVAEVARAFIPDIIFADVLLQKKNGYEVCAELKRDPALKVTPLVLMWSSFMDLDEKQAASAQADRRLEKPFDVENLRQLIMELVPKTRSQRLAHFLQFPEEFSQPMRDEIIEKAPKTPPPLPPKAAPTIAAPQTAATVAATAQETSEELATEELPSWNMDSFEDIGSFSSQEPGSAESDDAEESFSELRIATQTQGNVIDFNEAVAEQEATELPLDDRALDDRDPWSHQDLSRFKLDLEPGTATKNPSKNNEDGVELSIDFGSSGSTLAADDETSDTSTTAADELELPNQDNDAAALDFSHDSLQREPSSASLSEEIPSLSADQLERLVRAQSREIIETLVRRIVPDLATQIIREELERLLEETEADKVENPR